MNFDHYYRREAETPTGTLNQILPEIQKVIAAQLNSLFEIPYRLTPDENKILTSLFPKSLKFLETLTADHPVVAAIHDIYRADIISQIKNLSAVLLLGSSFKEFIEFTRQCPNVTFHAVIGKLDAKDEARLIDGLLYSKKLLKSGNAQEKSYAAHFQNFCKGVINPFFSSNTSYVHSTFVADVAVALNSVYDITPKMLACYYQKFQFLKTLGTMIFAPEILKAKTFENELLRVSFEKNGNYVIMKHLGSSNGYYNDYKNFIDWNYHSFFVLNNVNFAMEVNLNKASFGKFTLYSVHNNRFLNVRHSLHSSLEIIRIFDVKKYLRYAKHEHLYVNSVKYYRLLNYFCRLDITQFEVTRMVTYAVGLMNKIVIGNNVEIQNEWSIVPKLMHKVIAFGILHASLLRAELFNVLKESITRAKSGGKRDWWITSILHRVFDWITFKNHLSILKDIDKCMYTTPEYIYDQITGSSAEIFLTIKQPSIIPVSNLEEVENEMVNQNPLPVVQKLNVPSAPPDSSKSEADSFASLLSERLQEVAKEEIVLSSAELKKSEELLSVYNADVESVKSKSTRAKKPKKITTMELPSDPSTPKPEPEYEALLKALDDTIVPSAPPQHLIQPSKFQSAPPEPIIAPATEIILDAPNVTSNPLPAPLIPEIVPNNAAVPHLVDSSTSSEQSSGMSTPIPAYKMITSEKCEKFAHFIAMRDELMKSLPTGDHYMELLKLASMGVEFSMLSKWKEIETHLNGKIGRVLDLGAYPGVVSNHMVEKGVSVVALSKQGGLKKNRQFSENLRSGKIKDISKIVGDDLTVPKNLKNLATSTAGNFDLVISDVGTDPKDRNHFFLNNFINQKFGQYLPRSLSRGGCLVVKLVFPIEDISIIVKDLYRKFHSIDLIKPLASKLHNNERYIVCTDYGGPNKYIHAQDAVEHVLEQERQIEEGIIESIRFMINKAQLRKWGDYTSSEVSKAETPKPESLQVVPIPQPQVEYDYSKNINLPYNFNMPYPEIVTQLGEGMKNYAAMSYMNENSYQAVHKKIVETREKIPIASEEFFRNLNVEVWNMVAGAGKTYKVLELFNPATDLYICPTTQLLAAFRDSFEKKYGVKTSIPAKTFDIALTTNLCQYRNIYIDEAFALYMAYFLMLFNDAPKSHFVLLGDVEQTQFLDEWSFIPQNQALRNYMHHFKYVKRSNVTYRFSQNVANILRHNFNYDIISRAKHFTRVTFSNFENRIKDSDLNITCRNNGVRNLADYNVQAVNVKKSQGMSVAKVNFFISDKDLAMLRVRDLALVSLSRASEHFNFVEMEPGILAKTGWNLYNIRNIAENYTPFVATPESHILTVVPIDEPALPKENLDGTPFVVSSLINVADCITHEENLNEAVELTAAGKFRPVRINTSNLPIWTKERKERLLNPQKFGKVFFVSSKKQTLFTALVRSVGPARAAKVNINIPDEADKNFWDFFDEGQEVLNEVNAKFYKELTEIYRKYAASKYLPNIDSTVENTYLIVWEHLKQIQKIRGAPDVAAKDKAGQPIRAWMKELNVAFAGYFRMATEMLMKKLKSRFIWANNRSNEEIEELLNKFVKGWNTTFNSDMESYDQQQNTNTQKLEKYLWNKIMFNTDLDLHYAVREFCKLMNEDYSMQRKEVKDSGAPDTIASNTLLLLFFMSLLFKVSELKGLLVKGDDSTAFGTNLTLSKDRFYEQTSGIRFKRFIAIPPKLVISEIPEFCNLIYYKGKLFYNYQTLIRKVLSRSHEEKNFSQYQTAIKDLMKPYNEDPETIIEGMSKFTGHHTMHWKLALESLTGFSDTSYKVIEKDLMNYVYSA